MEEGSLAVPIEAVDQEYLNTMMKPPRIRVIVRKRPMNGKEIERGEMDVLQCEPEVSKLTVHEPREKVDLTKYTETHSFRFDDVFDSDVDNDSLYAMTIRPLIATLFKSGRGTCFAYGQTGSGKTYTMQPLPLRAASDIFYIIQTLPEFQAATLHVSCYEIYGGKIFDLLNDRNRLEAWENAKRKVEVVGLKELEVNDLQELSKLCDHAACARSTGSTGANDESSRSHSIMNFALNIPKKMDEKTNAKRKIKAKYGHGEIENPLQTIGKLSFIDLAGSERGADTYDNDKQTRLEGAEINKSLLALKECIRALGMGATHVPFRGSKLTSVLRDSFVGKNARTVMIANVSPSSNSCEHTLNTLRYADRVKEIKKDGVVKVNARICPSKIDAVSKLLLQLPTPNLPVKKVHDLSRKDTPGNEAFRDFKLACTPRSPSDREVRRNSNGLPQQVHGTMTPRRVTKVDDPGARGKRASASHQSTPGPSAHPLLTVKSDSIGTDDHTPMSSASFGGMVDSCEEDLILAHRQHVESTMRCLSEDMDLIMSTDTSTDGFISMEEYVEELSNALIARAASIAALQQQVLAYKKHLRSLQ